MKRGRCFLDIKKFNLGPSLYIIGYHLLLMIALPLYLWHHTPSWQILTITAVILYLTGLGITAGYHRLFSHTTYKAHPIFEFFIMLLGTMATQGSVLRWSFDHRHHHAFVDTDRDPYSIKKGFWYAHFLWLLEKPKPIENKIVADLLKKPMVCFQHRYYGLLMVLTNLLTSLVVGWYLNDYLGAFLFVWLVRTFLIHHFTWFINSLAHTWGARPFCQELSAVDNYLISMLTWGEGYHNYHHTFASDYRNGIRWFHYDPTKWLIWTLSKVGLASRLKKHNYDFIERRIILERKELLLNKIQASFVDCKRVWEEQVETLTDCVLGKLQEFKKAKEDYLELKRNNAGKNDALVLASLRVKVIKKELKAGLNDCKVLARQIISQCQTAGPRVQPILD
jgi:stearoyl-CoA desaturase (Delta-9 desaturase)